MQVFNREICSNLELSSRKEWLETNGLGGYAFGTVAGMHTRSYHTLLTIPLENPLHRMMMLSQLEEAVHINGQKYSLSTHHYGDAIAPHGYLNIEEFRLDPFPVIIYQMDSIRIKKQIFMTYGKNLTWITYQLLSPLPDEQTITLSVRPLANFRDYHLRQRNHRFFSTHHDLEKKIIRLLPDQKMPALHLHHNAASFEHSAHWYHHLFYREEKLRGLECEEDLFAPGVLNYTLSEKDSLGFLAATSETLETVDALAAAQAERIRREQVAEGLSVQDPFVRCLARSADQFLVKRDEGLSVIAGYPWLPDSGRDAMIALPGLLLVRQRLAEAESVLLTQVRYCSEGMIPNYFTEFDSKPYYNTVDAALWFVLAVDRYHQAGGQEAFIREKLWDTMREIVRYYQSGIRYNIRMDQDGLIDIPEEGAQLTWMDAQVGDWIVTPRSGKTVEVNALWYNTVCIVKQWAEHFNQAELAESLAGLAQTIERSFKALFWNEKLGYLNDRVENHFCDTSLRPNQLLAMSLPFPLITGIQAQRALQRIYQDLYTPFGFRTLDPHHEDYKKSYEGDIIQREGAAYQGTVWPWLLGPYADALRKVRGDTPAIREEIQCLLKPFAAHLQEDGLGTISEMFDGDQPHQTRGCISRAWSVAEILRIYLETKK